MTSSHLTSSPIPPYLHNIKYWRQWSRNEATFRVNKLILNSQTIKLSFALRSSCQAAEWSNFILVSSVTSCSDSGRTLRVEVDQEISFVNHYTSSIIKLYNGSTWLYFTLLHTAMALRGSTSLYLTPLHSSMGPLGSTWLYYTLPWLRLSLPDSTTLYHATTWLYWTVLPSTMDPLGSTWLY